MTSEQQHALMMAQIVLADEKKKAPLTQAKIAWAADKAIAVMPHWKDIVDRHALISELESRETHWIGKASVLDANDDHIAWLDAARKTNWRLWARYSQSLRYRLSNDAVEAVLWSFPPVLALLVICRGMRPMRKLCIAPISSCLTVA